MKIFFSELAIESLQEIINFLSEKWTNKEISVMRNDIEVFQQKVLENFKIYPISKYDKNVREALIGNKQVKILFEIKNLEVHILLFWSNKGNTDRLFELLKK